MASQNFPQDGMATAPPAERTGLRHLPWVDPRSLCALLAGAEGRPAELSLTSGLDPTALGGTGGSPGVSVQPQERRSQPTCREQHTRAATWEGEGQTPTAAMPQGPREGDQSSMRTLGLLLGPLLATLACVPALQAGRGSYTVSVTLWPKLEPAEQ